jgi:Zn-dependent peptidase ImmA (M78 family)
MGTRWQLQLGNTTRFALLIAFEDDPDDGAGATREMAASWGAFQIWVRGQNLCAHTEEGETVTSVHWYLLPMLEWIAENWQPLLHEEKLPVRNAADDASEALYCTALPAVTMAEDAARSWETNWYAWRSRHALEACREGGLFPDVVFRRFRDRVEVSWGEAQLAGAPQDFKFLSSRGVERLVPNDVAAPLFNVLQSAVQFLADEFSASARLKSLVQRVEMIRSVSNDERLAWMVGLGQTWSEMRGNWNLLRKQVSKIPNAANALWENLHGDLVAEGSCQVALMFGSSAPMLQMEDVLQLAQRGIEQYVPSGHVEPRSLTRLVREQFVPLDRRVAFEDGYRLAEEFLQLFKVDLENSEQVDVEAILRRLKIDVDNLKLRDSGIRAIAMAGPHHRTAIMVNTNNIFNSGSAGRRFTLAHELCHILHDRDVGRELSLISGPWAPLAIERRANAFAAMLLMPVLLVKRAISELSMHEDTAEGVRTIARRLGTSASATVEHVGNLQQWDDATRERVRAELEPDVIR